MRVQYYRIGSGFIAVTGESPKGFKGVVFAGKGPTPGGGPDTVTAQAWAVNQLDHFEKIEARDVPDEWFNAFGYEEREIKPVDPPADEPESPVVIDVTWFPFAMFQSTEKATDAEKRHADWIALAIALAFVLYAFLRAL